MSRETAPSRTLSTQRQFGVVLTTQLQQLLRARKTLILLVVHFVPVIAAIIYVFWQDMDGLNLFRNVVELITYPFLIPMTAIFYGGPAIVEEMEGRTLTYLTLRPVPKPVLYLGKVLAGCLMGCAVTLLPMLVLFFVCLGMSDDMAATAGALGQFSLGVALGIFTYSTLFALLGTVFATSLLASIIYFVIFELVFGALPVLELLSVRFYLRTIAEFNASDRLGPLEQLVLEEPLHLDWWVGAMITGALVLIATGAGSYTFQEKQFHV